MYANPFLLGQGLLLVMVVLSGAVRLVGNRGRDEDPKQFPSHAIQGAPDPGCPRLLSGTLSDNERCAWEHAVLMQAEVMHPLHRGLLGREGKRT